MHSSAGSRFLKAILGQAVLAFVATAADAQTVTFSKSFAPGAIAAGGTSTLTFTIDSHDTSDITALDFTDNLPAGVVVATPANASTTCTGGTLTAPGGGGTIAYTNGTVAAMSSCTVSVDTTSSAPGSHTNTSGDLTCSAGNFGTATATLTVTATPPAFSKAFSGSVVSVGDTSTLTFTVDNTSSLVAATALDFTDNLPAGVVVASPPNASTTCTGGTLTAPAGGGTIAYTGGTVSAAAVCTVRVDTTGNAVGVHANTSGDLTSSAGNSGPSTDTLTVVAVAPVPALDLWWLILLAGLIGIAALQQLQARS